MFWFWFVLLLVVVWVGDEIRSSAASGGGDTPARLSTWAKVGAMVVISPVIAIVAVFLNSCTQGTGGASGSSNGLMSDSEALSACQFAIQKSMRDPDNTDVPYVQDFGNGLEAHFAWGASTKMIRTRNGLGLEVPASASCILDRKTRQITQLSINGQTLR